LLFFLAFSFLGADFTSGFSEQNAIWVEY